MPFITQGKANLKYILIVVFVIIFLILVGRIICSYFFDIPPITDTPLTLKCFLKGGFPERVGLWGVSGHYSCVIHYSDGGKPCTDSDQCKGACKAGPSSTEGRCEYKDTDINCPDGKLEDGRFIPSPCWD